MDKSKREALLERRRAEKRKGQMRWITFTVITALGAAALLIFFSQVRGPGSKRSYLEKNGSQLGNPDAPVTIIEYGDFQCSHCQSFYATIESLLINNHVNSGEVLFEFRAVDFLGPESKLAAEAAYCAADQNMFWEYHDVVFTNYSTGNSGGYSEERLIDFAETLEMDQNNFMNCLRSGEKAQQVAEDVAAAAADGVTGTPSFLVNGLLLGGNRPYSDLQEAIAAALGSD